MYAVHFSQETISGDSHWVDIICATKQDAQKILDYILAHDENIHNPSVEKYIPLKLETFESWISRILAKQTREAT